MTTDALGKLAQTPAASAGTAARAVAPGQDAKRAARDFEAVFLTQVVEEMLATVNVGSFGGGEAEKMWRGVLAQSVADQIADRGGIGIAPSVEGTIAAYRAAGKG